ncbi:hypothetical protein GIB67_039481 [Kingdonia uniflora]|uniref:TOD1/MUCI70 glycosyltransferase-like domain-containing protein n=1 Tax=Kingdonia uniflora TaxID=39325 RepID=A0A7J7LIQ0_9MAGN|nr:hypothetical protein GIB67_039481 [Kingdonia uniflora]
MSVLVSICKVVTITHDYNKSDLEISAGYGLFLDEDVPDSADPNHTQHVQSNIANVSTPSKFPESPPIVGIQDKIISRHSLGEDQENSSTLPNNMSGLKERNVQPLAPIIPKSIHPCAKFALLPPPADKKTDRSSSISETKAYMKNSSSLNEKKKVGIWRVVIVRNLPYKDARCNGKILKRFSWRNNAIFAISWYYRRFDVFEVEAKKAARKYSNASIDNQVEFYKREGLNQLFYCKGQDNVKSKLDSERCNFVVQGYHRDLLEHMVYSLAVLHPPPPPPLNKPVEKSPPLTNEPVGKSTQEATKKIAKLLPSNPGKAGGNPVQNVTLLQFSNQLNKL